MFKKSNLVLLAIFGISLFFNYAYAENYVYELSKNESDQIIISELCYAGVDVGECDLLYGGIDTIYGDKQK